MNPPGQPAARRCQHCGAPLDGDSASGLCLRCALGNALEAESEGQRLKAKGQSSGGIPDDGEVGRDVPIAPTTPSPHPACGYSLPSDGRGQGEGQRFGDYELLTEIARGGMGVVYRARQVSLDRIVALKMLLFGPLASKEFVQRFRTEATAAASLHHPNIVAIHEVGVHEGQQYLTMDLVEGPTLAKLVTEKPLPGRRAAGYVRTISEAIHYAHERGILHRDLKPSNVLIDTATDQPRVTDFGLAKRFALERGGTRSTASPSVPGEVGDAVQRVSPDSSLLTPHSSLTLTGQALGSPNYMPPEQAGAGRIKVGRHSDVYSLGAILYHLLTGRAPFLAETVTDTLQLVQSAEPVSPRVLNPSVPRDLQTICLKCLEKEPVRRYQTAQALGDELGRFLGNEPILARPIGRTARCWRWCRRKPAIAGLAGSLALVLLLGLVSVLWQWQRAVRAEADARGKGLLAENGRQAARRHAYAAEINVALQALAENNLARAVELLDRQRPMPGEEDLRDFEWRYLWELSQTGERATFRASAPSDVAFSPDGGLLVSAEWERAVVREASSYRVITNLPVKATTVSFSSREKLVAIGTRSSVTLWDTVTWQPARPPLPGATYLARFSADGRWLATYATNGFEVWNAETWKPVGVCPGRSDAGHFVRHILAFSPNGQFLATPILKTEPNECRVNVWKLPALELVTSFPRARPGVGSATFTPDGKHLLLGRWDGSLVVWDFLSNQVVQTLKQHTSWVTVVVVAPDGKTFATASSDQTLSLWSAGTCQHLVRLRGHQDEVWSLAMSPDGRTLASGSMDKTLKLWDAGTRHEPAALDGSSIPAGFTPDGRVLVAATTDGARLWNLANHTSEDIPMGASEPHIFAVHRLAVTGKEPIAALGKTNGMVELWNLATHSLLTSWLAHSNAIDAVAFCADAKRLATSDQAGNVTVWDVATRMSIVQFHPVGRRINCLTFSPDGKALAGCGASSEAWLWNLVSRHRPIELPGHPDTDTVVTIAFSPDGKLVATCTLKRAQVRLWEFSSGKLWKTLLGHVQGVIAVAFSPDGKTLASASHDHKVKLWHVATHQEMATFSVDGMVRALRFSPDGRTLAVGYYDDAHDRAERIRLWRAPSLAEIERAEHSLRHRPSR